MCAYLYCKIAKSSTMNHAWIPSITMTSNFVIFTQALIISEIFTFKMFEVQKVGQDQYCNFRNYALRWQMYKSANAIFYIFNFRWDTTCVGDCNMRTHRHTHKRINHNQNLADVPEITGARSIIEIILSKLTRNLNRCKYILSE